MFHSVILFSQALLARGSRALPSVLFYAALRSSGYSNPVVIDAEDTDVYIQAVAISHDIPGIICIKKKKQMLFCRGMCTDEDIAKCLIPFHVMNDCDANSCFYAHGKMLLYEKMAKNPEARSLLSKCGESLPLTDNAHNDLKSYVIRYHYVYGDVQKSSLDLAKWKKQKKKSLMQSSAAHQMCQLLGLHAAPS